MISERQFATGFPSVWNRIAPLSDGYWKVQNLFVRHSSPAIDTMSNPKMRGAINEAGFRAFCSLRVSGIPNNRTNILGALERSIPDTLRYLARIAPRSAVKMDEFDDECWSEAEQIASRLCRFFSDSDSIATQPKFRGCGIISPCEGDVLDGSCLYEIKAGDRTFRITDLRQLLVYSALSYASGALTYRKIGLYNPRTGAEWVRTLDQVCRSISGMNSVDVLSALVDQFSSVSVSR